MACSNCSKQRQKEVAQLRQVRGNRPCQCDKATCKLCTLYATDNRYRRLWGGPAPELIELGLVANGIGDILCAGLAITAVRKENPTAEITFFCKADNHAWLDLFDHGARLLPLAANLKAKDLNTGYDVECLSKAAVPRWKRYCVNAGVAEPVIPRLKDLDRLKELGKAYEGFIVLCPFSVYNNRNWSIEHWLTLETSLIEAGYKTCIIHNNPSTMIRFQGDKLSGKTPEYIAGVMLNAGAVIGVDTGLSWLSSLIHPERTVVLFGPTAGERKVYFTPIVGIQGKTACTGCFWQSPYSQACDLACASLWTIQPSEVMEAVDKIVLPKIADRSLMSAPELAALRDSIIATNHLPGLQAELGTYRGGSAKLILKYGHGDLHLFDTWKGQPADDAYGEHKAGDFADCSLDDVKAYLCSDRVTYHQGPFGSSLPDTLFRFVHLDCDTYQGIRDGLLFFKPRMMKGGRILVSDYGWWRTPGVAKAVTEICGPHVLRPSEYQAVIVC